MRRGVGRLAIRGTAQGAAAAGVLLVLGFAPLVPRATAQDGLVPDVPGQDTAGGITGAGVTGAGPDGSVGVDPGTLPGATPVSTAPADGVVLPPLDDVAPADATDVDLPTEPEPGQARRGAIGPGGLRLTFDVDQTLRLSDNPDLDADPPDEPVLTSRTGLGFSAATRTRTQELSVTGRTALTYDLNEDDEDDERFEDPVLQFAYARQARDARLTASGSIQRSEVGDSIDVDLLDAAEEALDEQGPTAGEDTIDDQDIVTDDGTRTDLAFDTRLLTGIDAPLGFDLSAGVDIREFDDTIDPDLFDSTETQFGAAVRLRFNPRLTLALQGRFSRFEAEDEEETERERRSLGVGADLAASDTLAVEAGIAAVEIDEEETLGGTRVSDTTEGFDASLAATLDRPRGALTLAFDQGVTTTGTRRTLSVGRDLALPAGDLSASLGVTAEDGGDLTPVAAVGFDRNLRDGALSLDFSTAARTDDDDGEIVNTELAAGYRRAINDVSGVAASVSLASRQADADDDRLRGDLRLSYTRDVTRNVGLTAGISQSFLDEGEDDASASSIFVTLGRSFVVRP